MRNITVTVGIDLTVEDEESAREKVEEALQKEFPDEFYITDVEVHD